VNWYKTSKIENNEDRNQMNALIHKLEGFSESLKYTAKLVFMTARGAKKMAYSIAQSKTLSSFPVIRDVLEQADRVALDSPNKFAIFCKEAAARIDKEVVDIKKQRSDYVNNILPQKMKGLIDE
jgi:hypothetical protein